MPTSGQIESIVAYGGGVEIDAKKFTVSQLESIAAYAGSNANKPTVRILNAGNITQDRLESIASYGKGTIVFVF